MKPRNPFAEAARRRRAGPMHDRRAPRGGARNAQVDLLAEADDPAAAEGVRVAVTGNRGLTPRDRTRVRRKIRRIVADPAVAEILFGGALGADTEALAAAHAARSGERPKLTVFVPDTLAEQPRETWATTALADEVVELRRPIRLEDGWAAYHERNRRLVDCATRLVAFWNGQARSGTGATIRRARERGIPVEIVRVEGGD